MPVFRATHAALLLIAFAAAPAQTPAPNAASDSFKAGLAAVQARDLPAAQRAFARVVHLAPQISAGHSALGAVLLQQGQPAQALPELRRALALNPADDQAELNLGNAAAALTDPAAPVTSQQRTVVDEGIAALTAWSQRGARTLPPDAAVSMARLQIAAGQPALAIAALTSALAADPADPALLDASGVLLAQQRSYPEAAARFRSALASTPALPTAQEAEIRFHLGSALLAAADAPGAAEAFSRAVALRPDVTQYRVQLGSAQFTAGDTGTALQTLREALRLDPSSAAAAYQLALTLESAGDSAAATPLFEQVRRERPDDPVLLTNLGLALVQTGRAREAVTVYQLAVAKAPNDSTVHQDLGVAYLQQSDLDHAVAEFQRAGELAPRDAQIAYDLGLAFKLKDDLPAAINAFRRAQTLDPTLADTPYTLGVLFMQQGQFGDAAASLRQATEIDPKNAETWAMLGSVLKQDEKPRDAAKALRQSIALDPGQPGPHVNLASVLVELGDKDEAVKERKVAAELSRTATEKQKERFALDSGRLLLGRGQFADAITQFRSAVATAPADPAAHLALADALAQSGHRTEAEAERSHATALTAH